MPLHLAAVHLALHLPRVALTYANIALQSVICKAIFANHDPERAEARAPAPGYPQPSGPRAGRMRSFARLGQVVDDTALTFGPRAVPLSVLDLAPVPDGGTAAQALRATIDLARHAERLGYRRFWVAEHHNMPGIASSAPPVLIGHIADATTTMRVGSGGVMLPNHVSLVVAEQFGMLEALHPGRIDLGIGRAPGTDQVTAAALRRSPEALSADDFPDQLMDLLGFFTGRWPENHPFAQITAVPGRGNLPAMWLLGSSGYSAQVAGLLGLPFAFAHHFSAGNTLPALALYRQHFRPSDVLDRPYAMVAAAVVCAETDERARFLAGRARCRSCGCAPAGPARCPHRRRRPPTPTTRWNARSSTTAWPPRSSAHRRPSSAASPTSSTPPRPTS